MLLGVEVNEEARNLIRCELLKRLDFEIDLSMFQIVSFDYPADMHNPESTSLGLGYTKGKNNVKQHDRIYITYKKSTYNIFEKHVNKLIDDVYERMEATDEK